MATGENDEDLHTMAAGTIWQSISSIVFKLASFLYTIIIARMVLQEEVGVFYFALGIVGMASIFADAGITHAIMRYIPYYIGKKERKLAQAVSNFSCIASSALPLLFSGIVFIFSTEIASFFGNPMLSRILQLLAIHISLYQVSAALSSILLAFKKAKESSIGNALQNISKLFLTVGLIFAIGASAEVLAIAHMLSFAIAGGFLFIEARKAMGTLGEEQKIEAEVYVSVAREMIPFALTMVAALSILNFIGYADRLMLGYLLKADANSQIAIYSLATSLSGLLGILASSISGIFFPIVSELVGKDEMGRMKKTASTALRWMLFATIPIAAFLIAFSLPMVTIMFGHEYASGALALSIFTAGAFAGWACLVQRTVLASMRLLKIELGVVTVTAVANVVLNYILIPPYGITGAALASALSLVGMAIMHNYFSIKVTGFGYDWLSIKNILAGVAVTAFLFLISGLAYLPIESFIAGIHVDDSSVVGFVLEKSAKIGALSVIFFLGAFLYFVLLNYLKLFEKDDAKVLERVLSKLGFPEWARRLAARMLFWNQREMH